MARRQRITPAGIPAHIIQRGNNRQITFACEDDFTHYAHWLKEYAAQHQVQIHAWCFMTNHVHLLATPQTDHGISKMMQSIGRQYVRYFNKAYQRTGTLWEGRYKSCLVEADTYLLELYRYIELNPVRAKMINHPSEYVWSSYQINALGKPSELCTPHPLYLALGNNKQNRLKHYQQLLQTTQQSSLIDEIRQATHKNLAVGNAKFLSQIEQLTGRRVTPAKRGRPKKSDHSIE